MKKNKLMILLLVLVALVAVYFGLSAYNKHAETKKEEEEKEAEIHLVMQTPWQKLAILMAAVP